MKVVASRGEQPEDWCQQCVGDRGFTRTVGRTAGEKRRTAPIDQTRWLIRHPGVPPILVADAFLAKGLYTPGSPKTKSRRPPVGGQQERVAWRPPAR